MKDNVFDDATFETISAFTPGGSRNLAQPVLATAGPATGSSGATAHLPALGWAVDEDERPKPGVYRQAGKRIADILFVLMALPMILPVVAFCALALWIEGGNPFYRQDRLGAGGKVFRIWKLRTMCRDADTMLKSYLAADPALREEWDRTQKLKNDPRITRVGNFLRKTSLDELPQFFNVLRGEMSVVGPRPMMPEQLPLYDNPAPYFDMRPGITGEWQVSDRNESSFQHRSTVDARYYAQLSFLVDLRILFQTFGVVLRRTGY